MNYTEAKAYITGASAFGSVMGLSRIKELLDRLSNPQQDLKFIHIAGTNGKGSVIAYLLSILMQAGYKIGHYSSPPLHSYREVIQINNQLIGREAIAKHMTTIKSQIDSMLSNGLSHPTRFEMEAALAFSYFREQACDLVLLETGLGGLHDATNIVQTSILEIITSISMDHMDILGHTLEEITLQKAGIIKPNTDVVSIRQEPAAETVLNHTCKTQRCTLTFAQPDRIRIIKHGIETQIFQYTSTSGNTYHNLTISLAGVHQFKNAAIAIEASERLNKLGYPITNHQLIAGLKNAKWNGRFTLIRKHPLVIIDGAHNEDASRQLAGSINQYFPKKRIIYLLGIFADKDYRKIIENTIHYADTVITVHAPEIKRLMPANELTSIVEQYHSKVITSIDIQDAVNRALCEADKDDVIIAFGSLSFLGPIQNAFSIS